MSPESGVDRELDELTRSLTGMHNINLQRVDRVTVPEILECLGQHRLPHPQHALVLAHVVQSVPCGGATRLRDSNSPRGVGRQGDGSRGRGSGR